MVDYNKDVERARLRRFAKMGAWSYLVSLSPADIHDVLMEMVTDVEDGAIPSVTPAANIASRTNGEIALPVAHGSPGQGGATTASVGRTSVTTRFEREPALPVTPVILEDEERDNDRDDDVSSADGERTAEMGRSVLQAARGKFFTAPQIIEQLGLTTVDAQRHRILQWLSREGRKKGSGVVRKGERGSYRYAMPPLPPDQHPAQQAKQASPAAMLDGEELRNKLLEVLSIEPSGDYGLLAQVICGVGTGAPRDSVRNALYYMAKGPNPRVRRREDGKWEVVVPH